MFNQKLQEQQCLSIHCGQTGVQWALSCWDLFAAEHNVAPGGKLLLSKDRQNLTTLYDFSPFYHQVESRVFKPRSLFLDCDDNVLDEPTYGPKLREVDPSKRVLGREQCASIFGQGVGSNGQSILSQSLEATRHLLEVCDLPQGIIWYHSLGGGTGSGFTTLLSRKLRQEHPKLNMHDFSLLPGAELTCAATDTYNSILGLHNSLETMGCTYLFDSDVLYQTCFNRLHINNPNHVVLNKVLAIIVADVTSTLRFPSFVNGTMADIECNLLPVRRMPFPLVCLQPLNTKSSHRPHEHFKDLIMSCFDKTNQVVNCSPKEGKIIRSCLVLRGLIDMEQVKDGLNALRNDQEFKFVTSLGSRTHTTCLLPSELPHLPDDPFEVSRTRLCSVTNCTAMSTVFQKLVDKFDTLFQQRAFLHWYYAEGMEESEFVDAREDVESLLENYRNIE